MSHPYKTLPDRNFWKRAVSTTPWPDVLAGEKGRFILTATDRIATAGSCFAQRISRVLKDGGFNFVEYESPHPLMTAEDARDLGYGRFSARYGNIYTPRQLRQLIDEAFSITPPVNKMATSAKGAWFDLLRPNINSTGFQTEAEARADRAYHLACVQKLFRESDYFIFTLGLTEAWMGTEDGVVYGVHPAVALGRDWNEPVDRINFDYIECYNDMVYVLNLMQQINPALRFIFTVSPVALAATHQDRHVLLATSYSKSVLRAVVGRLVDLCPQADYFCSFEVFNAAQSFGQFLSDDLRDVNNRGVSVAMGLFQKMYMATADEALSESRPVPIQSPPAPAAPPSSNPAAAECDEILNTIFNDAGRG